MSNQSNATNTEATIPSQLSNTDARNGLFTNTNRLLRPEDVPATFNFNNSYPEPPFSTSEQLVFATAFKDSPKEYEKIAAVLPGRSVKDCIDHYYAFKAGKRFKLNTKAEIREKHLAVLEAATRNVEYLHVLAEWAEIKRKGGRAAEQLRQRLDAGEEDDEDAECLYDYEEDPDDGHSTESPKREWQPGIPLIDQEIQRLTRLFPGGGRRLYRKAPPQHAMQVVTVRKCDLSVLQPSFDHPFHETDEQLLKWLRSGYVLPLISRWREECEAHVGLFPLAMVVLAISNDETARLTAGLARSTTRALATQDVRLREWTAEQLASAGYRGTGNDLQSTISVLMLCGKYAKLLVRGNEKMFNQFAPYTYPDLQRYVAAARMLLTAYHDLSKHGGQSFFGQGNSSFFGTLLSSELAAPIKLEVRPAWEAKYPFAGESAETQYKMPKRAAKARIADDVVPASLAHDADALHAHADEYAAGGPLLRGRGAVPQDEKDADFTAAYRKWQLETEERDREQGGEMETLE